MKKSCSAKESKVVSTKDAKNVLNAFKEDSQQNLTEEQILINKKLSESGIEDEGLGWLEKRNIFRTINVSLDTAGSDRLQRSSPRFTKAANSKATKWIENSFENPKQENIHNEKQPKVKPGKDSESTSTKKRSPLLSRKTSSQDAEAPILKLNHKPELTTTSRRDVDTSNDLPKSSKKVHYIKVHVEENSKEECNSLAEGVGKGLSSGKKRASQPETSAIETPKKLKMDERKNGISSEDESSLQVELKMEKKKCSEPFKVRDIKTIVLECEMRNKKWKETFSKYKGPTRWGMPIVRNCSEKWDGKQIPPKLLHRFRKYLSSNDLTHPVFLPVKLQSSVDLNRISSEISSQLGTSENSEGRVESESDVKDLGEGSSIRGEINRTGLENNLNMFASSQDTHERMVLRNRSQQRTIISDEEEFSSDDSDDWLVKQKSTKKQKFNAKNKKASDQSNKQLVLKLERCNINKGNGHDGSRKNDSKNDISFTGGSMMPSNALNQACGISKSGPDSDTMVCPICSLRFKKQFIESHATECASKTYKD